MEILVRMLTGLPLLITINYVLVENNNYYITLFNKPKLLLLNCY